MDENIKGEITDQIVGRADAYVESLLTSRSREEVRGALHLYHEEDKLDIVISGGGFRGQYAGGVPSVLQLLEEKGVIDIDRWAGASIGACSAASFANKIPFREFFRVPFAWQSVFRWNQFWKSHQLAREMVRVALFGNKERRERARKTLLKGKVFISITSFDGIWPKNVLVSDFEDNDEFLDAIMMSSSIPFFSMPAKSNFRGLWSLDGGLTGNTPIFVDGKTASQLVINLGYLKYSIQDSFGADENHHHLVMKGQDDILAVLEAGVKESKSGGEDVIIGKGGEVKALRLLKRGDEQQFLNSEKQRHWLLGFMEFDLSWFYYGFRSEFFTAIGCTILLLYLTDVYEIRLNDEDSDNCPSSSTLQQMTVKELRSMCIDRQISYQGLRKGELIAVLEG